MVRLSSKIGKGQSARLNRNARQAIIKQDNRPLEDPIQETIAFGSEMQMINHKAVHSKFQSERVRPQGEKNEVLIIDQVRLVQVSCQLAKLINQPLFSQHGYVGSR